MAYYYYDFSYARCHVIFPIYFTCNMTLRDSRNMYDKLIRKVSCDVFSTKPYRKYVPLFCLITFSSRRVFLGILHSPHSTCLFKLSQFTHPWRRITRLSPWLQRMDMNECYKWYFCYDVLFTYIRMSSKSKTGIFSLKSDTLMTSLLK